MYRQNDQVETINGSIRFRIPAAFHAEPYLTWLFSASLLDLSQDFLRPRSFASHAPNRPSECSLAFPPCLESSRLTGRCDHPPGWGCLFLHWHLEPCSSTFGLAHIKACQHAWEVVRNVKSQPHWPFESESAFLTRLPREFPPGQSVRALNQNSA